MDPATDKDLYDIITSAFTFPVTEDNLFYANVVSFLPSDEGNNTPVEIEPNTIYRMNEVLITPENLGTGTVKISSYNIIVKVDILNYNEVNVRPGF